MLGNNYVIRKKRFLASADEECVCMRARARAHAASPDALTPMISTAAASSPVTTFPFDGIISLHAVQPNSTKLSL
jgi:hypothetical protein